MNILQRFYRAQPRGDVFEYMEFDGDGFLTDDDMSAIRLQPSEPPRTRLETNMDGVAAQIATLRAEELRLTGIITDHEEQLRQTRVVLAAMLAASQVLERGLNTASGIAIDA